MKIFTPFSRFLDVEGEPGAVLFASVDMVRALHAAVSG